MQRFPGVRPHQPSASSRDALATDPALHPSPEALKRFMHVELERGEARAVVRHLLGGCSRCRQVTQRLWDLGEQPRPDKYLLEEMRRLVRAGLGGAGVF